MIRRTCCEALEARRLLAFAAPVDYAVGSNPLGVASGDFNNDSRLDLVTANADSVSVLLGNGDGTFQPAQTSAGGAAGRLTVGDVNADGVLDLVSSGDRSYTGEHEVRTQFGNGDGTFAPPVDQHLLFGYYDGTYDPPIAFGDLNGDGKLDVVAEYYQEGSLSFGTTQYLVVGLGQGDGTFAGYTAFVRLFRGSGGGHLEAPRESATGFSFASSLAVGDFNADARPDLNMTAQGADAPEVSTVLLGSGDGFFQAPRPVTPARVAGDVNGDGFLDLVSAGEGVDVFRGNGDGSFAAPVAAAAGSYSDPVVLGDFNADGRLDAAAANANGVSVLLNDGVWATKTYIGPTSGGNWSTAANWSPSGVPQANDGVTISGKSVNLSANTTVGGLNLTGGATLTLGANGGRVLRTSSLSISSNSKLNLTDNDLLIDYTGASPYAAVKGYVVTGRNTGTGGILTSAANDTALAVVDNAQFGRTSWNGQSVDASTIIGKYTFFGDANLDGKVTGDDYLAVDGNLGLASGTRQWLHGDFNFDGAVTGDDYLSIDANLGKGTTNSLAYADDQSEMIALHAEQFGGESYIKSIEQAMKLKHGKHLHRKDG